MRYDQKHNLEGARERLLMLVSAAESSVAEQAALTLGALGDQRAVGPLSLLLSSLAREKKAAEDRDDQGALRMLSNSSQKRKTVELLGQLQASVAVEPLLSMLNPLDENIDFQRAIFKALAQIGGEHIVERLISWLNPESHPFQAYPFSQEEMESEQFRKEIKASMRAASFQQEVLAALGRLGGSRVAETLLKLINPRPEASSGYDFQLHLLKALASLNEGWTIEPLAQWLNPAVSTPSEGGFQKELVKTLRQLGDTRADLEAVELAIRERNKNVKRSRNQECIGPASTQH